MGLLDDAIREHLDLKRRRGADPTEIERAEREALGPVRRSPELPDEDPLPQPAAEGLPPEELSDDLGPEYTAAHPDEHWAPLQDDAGMHDQAPVGQDEPPRREPSGSFEEGNRLAEERPSATPSPGPDAPLPAVDYAPALEPEPAPPPHPEDAVRPAGAHQDQDTEEHELEPEDEAEDDMLESTPEFLQDAPDHDRLWFEQRPPRDFDFDG